MERLRIDDISNMSEEFLTILATGEATSLVQECQNMSDADIRIAWVNIGPWGDFDSMTITCLYEEMRRRKLL